MPEKTAIDNPDGAPPGWPPGERPAFVIVVSKSVAWALIVLALASVVLLATIALRLDTLATVVAVQRSPR